jgi:protein associated with RNAse G/E
MKDFKNYLDIILALCGLTAIIYRIAQVEAKIYQAIDSLKDDLIKEVTTDKHKLELHLIEWQEKKENYAYRLASIEQLVKHKFERLANWIKQITGFLSRESNFIIRDDEW